MNFFLRTYIPAHAQARRLASISFASSVADGGFYAGMAVYLLTIVKLDAIDIATALSLTALTGFISGLFFGFVTDRVSAKGPLVALILGAAIATAAYIFVDTRFSFMCAVALHRFCQKGSVVIRAAILPRIVDEASRVVVKGQFQALYNTGLSLGTFLAGIAIGINTREAFQALFLISAACHLVACLFACRLDVPGNIGFTGAQNTPVPGAGVMTDRFFLEVFGLHAVMLLNVPIIDIVLPYWVITYTIAPTWIVPALFALNTVMAILFQVRTARRVTSTETAIHAYRLAGLLLCMSFIIFAATAFTDVVWVA